MNDPRDIFKKFSPSSRKVLISSQNIAQSARAAINSQHLLLALSVTPGTLVYSILQEHMISLDQIRLVISLEKNKARQKSGLTEEFRQILEKSALIAKNFLQDQIDPEHLLLAIVTMKESLGYQTISRIGANPEIISQKIKNIFNDIKNLDSKPSMPLHPQMETSDMRFGNHLDNNLEIPFSEVPTSSMPPQKNTLDYFTIDLTKQAKEGKCDPLIGREKEIQRVIHILSRRTKNNPVLVGEPGVGKTAIVEGLAQRIINGQVPEQLISKKIIILDLALLVAGTMYRGQFEDRIKKIMDELEKLGNCILFIDELHTVVGAGSAEGSLDAANILKPALAKGKIRLIGATTQEEYRKSIEKDSALERRLQKVMIEEPSHNQSVAVLNGLRPKYEEYHQVKITDDAIMAAVNLSERYITDRFLPDKAIDLIDEAAAAIHLKMENKNSPRIQNLEKQLKMVNQQKDLEVQNQNYQKAAELRDLEIRLNDEITYLKQRQKRNLCLKEVTYNDVARAVSLWTNVPVEKLTKNEKQKFLNLAFRIKKYIIGQNEAIREITQAIRRSKTGITDPNRPIGSFVFLGPTGVGKTEIARVLAQELFGSRDSIIKIDMSEFMERHNVSRLVGAPPGYVGYEEAGRLTEEVRRHPYSIVLFDEIEKAHPEVFNILLQILEDGQLTDAKGKIVNFRNTIIILTSNIGLAQLNQQAAIGFKARGGAKRKAEDDYQRMKDDLLKKLKEQFRPELVNRLDKIVVFRPLDKKDIAKIVVLNLKLLQERLQNQGFYLEFSPQIKNIIIKKGFDPQYGARPIRRVISDLIEDPLSEQILAGKIKRQEKIKIKTSHNQIVFKKLKNLKN